MRRADQTNQAHRNACRMWAMMVALIASAGGLACGRSIVYVDDDAPAGGDGQSWATAFRTIREATPDTGPTASGTIVRVAQGVYTPRDGATPSSTDSVMLIGDMSIYGGYRGLSGGGSPDDRDPSAFPSVLDGGVGTSIGTEDDTQTLIRAIDCPAIVVDGLHLRNAQGEHILATDSGTIIIRACRFTNDPAMIMWTALRIARATARAEVDACEFTAINFDSAVVNISDAARVSVRNCSFRDNNGGDVVQPQVEYVLETYRCGSVEIDNCELTGNYGAERLVCIVDATTAHLHGLEITANGLPFRSLGGLIKVGRITGPVLIEDCSLTGNTLGWDLGMTLDMDGLAEQTIRRCIIARNTCNTMVVRAQNWADYLAIEDTLIVDNTSVFISGVTAHCPLFVRGSTIASNRATLATRTAIVGTPTLIQRSIIWGNQQGSAAPSLEAQLRPQDFGAVFDSTVTGIPATNGNLAHNPLFVSAADYRLSQGSPAINLGLNPLSAPLNARTDLEGGPRVVGRFIDAGCYEASAAPACGQADLAHSAVRGVTGYRIADNTLSGEDFFAYLEAWTLGDAAADLTTTAMPGSPGYGTPNGVLSHDDFFYYLGLFQIGC